MVVDQGWSGQGQGVDWSWGGCLGCPRQDLASARTCELSTASEGLRMFAHRSALQDVYINSISFSSNGRNVVCSRDNGVIDLVNVECARCVSLPLAGGCLILSPSGVAHWDAVLCDLTALTADTVLIFHAHGHTHASDWRTGSRARRAQPM